MTVLFVAVLIDPAFANNLVISNVTLEDRNASANTAVVQFDISWDHSWRKDDGRHDAAWVFVKIHDVGNDVWVHSKMYIAGTNPTNTSSGSNPDLKIVIPSDKIGAFISRQASGKGTLVSKKVRLIIDYNSSGAITDSTSMEVRLFGIEMIYIPEGPFYAGDGDGSQESAYAFHVTDNTARQITTSGSAITVDSNGNEDIDTSPITVTGLAGITSNTSWPNGYGAFYLMKYELTQAQYVDFLNVLTRTQQGRRVAATVSADTIANYYVMSNGASVSYRQGIRAPAAGNGTTARIVFGNDLNDNGTFNQADDGQSLAMNYLSWMDMAAYADWAGLRPMTELEYEKAARGPSSAVLNEYAWGSTAITSVTSVTNSGFGIEVAGQTGGGLANYNSGGVSGPLRVGFAATNATNRKSAGAGYYGNMNFSGNLIEKAVTLGTSTGRAFTGTAGDGLLTSTASYEGNATNTDWPGINATTARGVTGATGSGSRGGGWDTAGTYLYTAGRTSAAVIDGTRTNNAGGRLARTAP